VGGSL
jgi:hypothetical protein